MNKGILIFAHNSDEVDYGSISVVAGGLAKKNLGVPVSLVSDKKTVETLNNSSLKPFLSKTFENIILTDTPTNTQNNRILYDGSSSKRVPFINQSRPNAFELTPYERTLLIDSDFFIFSKNLNHYWDLDSGVLIADSFLNIRNESIKILDSWVSEIGPPLRWATTVMFSKNIEGKIFFDLVSHIKENYNFYSNIYKFNPRIYRNDIAFSVAKHILDRFSTDHDNNLPPVFSVIDRDSLEFVKNDGRLVFSLGNELNPTKVMSASIKDRDVHIMNKESIIRNLDNLIGLI
jgi:hypothetical protein